MIKIKDLILALETSGFAGDLNIDGDKSFTDNNIDSLDVFSMLSEIEEKYNVTIDDDEFPNFNTPHELISLINTKLSS